MRHVYLLECAGKFKIGHSADVEKRLRGMATGNPFPIRVLHTIPTKEPRELEKSFHEKFAEKRTTGEWFELSPGDIAEFTNYVISVMREQLEHERYVNTHLLLQITQARQQTKREAKLIADAIEAGSLQAGYILLPSLISFKEAKVATGFSERILREAARNGELTMTIQGGIQKVYSRQLGPWVDRKMKEAQGG